MLRWEGGVRRAVGVEAVQPNGGVARLLVVQQETGWVTFDAMPDPGTTGASLPYSVRTAGVMLNTGQPLLIDVFAGAARLTGS